MDQPLAEPSLFIVNDDPRLGGSQTLWADATYIKDLSLLDRLTPRQLLRLAIILHECYRSVDLAHLLLAAQDLATGSRVAASYLPGISGPQRWLAWPVGI